VTLRFRFLVYLAAVHILMAATAAAVLWSHRPWLLAAEAGFAISFAVGIALVRSLFGTLAVVRSGSEFISDRDFTARFPETGIPELDSLVGVYNSMADRLRAERVRTEEQRHFLERLLAVSPLGIVQLDYDGLVSEANPAALRLLRRERDELVGRRLPDIDDAFAFDLGCIQPGESRVLPLWGSRRIRCQRGEFIDRGFPRGFFTLEELTEELRQTEKAAFERIIRVMSHEVNNSVGAASSLLQSCLHYTGQLRAEDRDDFQRALQIVLSRTAELGAFMRGFAAVFRVPAPRCEPCDLDGLLRDAAALLRADFGARQVSMAWPNGASGRTVVADRAQMQQVFLNLLKNAAEAIGERGTVTVRTGVRDGRTFAAVEDSGPGITPEVRAQLFTPFFSTKDGGQGVGLTLVREILENHGFDFSLESEPGQATRFTVYFESAGTR
jgi:two-component system, NtrC family, nitrogen regulation sensor histidine kinase NtrY